MINPEYVNDLKRLSEELYNDKIALSRYIWKNCPEPKKCECQSLDGICLWHLSEYWASFHPDSRAELRIDSNTPPHGALTNE